MALITSAGNLTVSAGALSGTLPISERVQWNFLESDIPANAVTFPAATIRIDVTGSLSVIGRSLICLCTTAWKYGGPTATGIDNGVYVDVPANTFFPMSMGTKEFTFYAKGTAGTYLTAFVTGL